MPRNNTHSSNESKAMLRCDLRRRRQGLSVETRARFDKSINEQLLQLATSRDAKSIACYWPFNGEPDITPVCIQLMISGSQFALPVISQSNEFSMEFHSWQPDATLTSNKYGIFEPQASAPLPVSSFDMLLMPLVGYDLRGNRLGLGAGYYDRHLETLRDSPTPLRVGIAYSLQEVGPINENAWDISLHAVVNELGWFTLG